MTRCCASARAGSPAGRSASARDSAMNAGAKSRRYASGAVVDWELAAGADAPGLPSRGETPTMARGSLGAVLRRTLLRLAGGVRTPDGQLLERFVADQDEAAFAELVRRHGPMVLRVCQRGLQAQDAEDAFQATFIVLARKAAKISPPDLLPNWLYGVACRV